MKKLSLLLLSLILIFCFTACGTEATSSDSTDSSSSSSKIESTVSDSLSDEITTTVKVTVTEAEESPVDSEEVEADSKEDVSSKEPVETAKPTATPKCGAVGHSTDGTCSVCGSTYTTPVATCPVCGSAEHTTHPALDNNQNVGDTHNPGDNGAGDNEIERPSSTTTPTPIPETYQYTCYYCGTGYNSGGCPKQTTICHVCGMKWHEDQTCENLHDRTVNSPDELGICLGCGTKNVERGGVCTGCGLYFGTSMPSNWTELTCPLCGYNWMRIPHSGAGGIVCEECGSIGGYLECMSCYGKVCNFEK